MPRWSCLSGFGPDLRKGDVMISRISLAAAALGLAACGSDQAPADPVETGSPTTVSPAPSPSPSTGSTSGEEAAEVAQAPLQDTIPDRFHGLWAESAEQCGTPGHQRYDISAREIGFFESTGEVQNVRVNGDYAGATVIEPYGDAPPAEYVFYMAIEGPDAMRIRYDDGDRINIVRCPPDSEG